MLQTLVVPRRGTSLGGLRDAVLPTSRPVSSTGASLDDANGEPMKLLLNSKVPARRHHFACSCASAALAQDTQGQSALAAAHSNFKDAPSSAERSSTGTVRPRRSLHTARVDTVNVYKTTHFARPHSFPRKTDRFGNEHREGCRHGFASAASRVISCPRPVLWVCRRR
jgi:hypothetical protein